MPPTPINAQFAMASVKMLGGAQRENQRKKYRGVLCARFIGESVSTADVILEIICEGDGYSDTTAQIDSTGLAAAAPPDKYAYVTMLNGTIRVWPTKGVDDKDTDHPALCSFSQRVLYAGELWINEYNMISKWNNGSGAFHPPAELNGQAGLPLTKFEAHVPS